MTDRVVLSAPLPQYGVEITVEVKIIGGNRSRALQKARLRLTSEVSKFLYLQEAWHGEEAPEEAAPEEEDGTATDPEGTTDGA